MNLLCVGLGYVGGLLGTALAERGHRVLGLRRSSGPEPVGVRVLSGDATAPDTWRGIARDIDQVLVLISAGQRSEAAYERTYLEGASSVRTAFPDARLLWVSSTAVYADETDLVVTDDTQAYAPGGTAAVLLRAEAAAQMGPHLIVRPSGIYGPERTSLLGRLTRAEIATAEREVWTNRIHRDDLVRCLTFCVERPELSGTLLASDLEPAQLGSMQDWVQAELSRRAAEGAVTASGGVPPVARAAALGRPASAEPRRSRRIVPTRLTELGFSWQYPSYRDGYAPLLGA